VRPLAFLLVCLSLTTAALAQSGVGVEVEEVIDNRMSAGPMVGSLELRVTLKGNGLDKASAARVLVKEARDDKGNALSTERLNDDFTGRDVNSRAGREVGHAEGHRRAVRAGTRSEFHRQD
jgi:hypothetical protein